MLFVCSCNLMKSSEAEAERWRCPRCGDDTTVDRTGNRRTAIKQLADDGVPLIGNRVSHNA